MSTERLIPFPLLVLDLIVLAQILAAGVTEKIAGASFMPAVELHGAAGEIYTAAPTRADGDTAGRNAALSIVLAAEENPTQIFPTEPADSKSASGEPKMATSEKAAPAFPTTKAPVGAKSVASSRQSGSATPTKSNAPIGKSAEHKSPDAKSPSILQMLEGHETELLIAAATAMAIFFIGWICGGNYYLRRDRRRRTKLRF